MLSDRPRRAEEEVADGKGEPWVGPPIGVRVTGGWRLRRGSESGYGSAWERGRGSGEEESTGRERRRFLAQSQSLHFFCTDTVSAASDSLRESPMLYCSLIWDLGERNARRCRFVCRGEEMRKWQFVSIYNFFFFFFSPCFMFSVEFVGKNKYYFYFFFRKTNQLLIVTRDSCMWEAHVLLDDNFL